MAEKVRVQEGEGTHRTRPGLQPVPLPAVVLAVGRGSCPSCQMTDEHGVAEAPSGSCHYTPSPDTISTGWFRVFFFFFNIYLFGCVVS